MQTRQSYGFRKFAIKVGKISFLKKILRPLYDKYTKRLEKNKNFLFVNNGLDVIKDFDECLTANGCPYTLAFGTMLGAVREHGFIKHDLDIDVAMWVEDYKPTLKQKLEEYGFKLHHIFLVDDGQNGREETYEKNGVSIDIFYIYPAIDQYPYCCLFLNAKDSFSLTDSVKKYGYLVPQRTQLPWKKSFVRVPFESLHLPITSNAHEILTYRYGDDYMIPNPKWTYMNRSKSDTIWEGKKGKAYFS